MKASSFLRTVAGSAALLFLAACDMGVAEPVPTSPEAAAVSPSPQPVASSSPPITQSYDKIETFQSASPGYNSPAGRVNGLTMSSGNPNAAETGAAQAPKNQDRLVNDTRNVVASGGTATITVTGNTDAQHQNTNNSVLAKDRAKAAAEKLAKEIGGDAKVAPSAAACGGAAVCIVYKANPLATNNAAVGRNATATATFVSPPVQRSTFTPPPAEVDRNIGRIPEVDSSFSPPSGASSPVFSSPGGSSGAPSTGSSAPASASAPASISVSTGPDFENFYPGELYPENVSLRIRVEASPQFRVGGSLRPEYVYVSSVDVMCGSSVCSSPAAPGLERVAGSWTVSASATVYKRCSSSRSTGCQFYVTSASSEGFSFPSIARQPLVLGFVSPTPSAVFAQPGMTLSEATVRPKFAEWVGGSGCSAAMPARSCWEFTEGDEVSVPVSVVSSRGEPFTRSGDSFVLRRVVTGSVGS